MKLKCSGIFIFIILMAFIAIIISGCGGGGGGTSDSSSKSSGSSSVGSVSMGSGTLSLPADGSSQTTITATVKDTDGNNVADGTTVNFTTTAGTLSAASVSTSNGLATVKLTSASNVGSTTVTGTSGGVSGTVTVNFVPGAVNSISLSATPNNLTADGVSTSLIKATVKDANNNAVANGETINFSVTTGTGALSSVTGITADGVATVTYTASNIAGTETVQAQSTNGTADTVNVTLVAATVGTVSLGSGASSITADGSSQTTITSTVKDTNGNNIADGTVVTFSTTAGALSGPTLTTNGKATVTLTSATNVGIATVTGTSGGASDTTTVNFVPGAVNNISLSAKPDNLTADNVSTSVIRAVVKDANSNAVANGETITFSMTAGTGTLSSLTGTTTGGVVTVTYTASNAAGIETVQAQSTNGTTKTVNVTLVAASVGSVALSSGTSNLTADGSSQTTITATVKDTGGNNVPDGTTVNFTTTAGTLSAASGTTANGLATVTLTSPSNVGSTTVTGTSGGVSDTATVNFVPGAVNTISLTATPNNLTADGASTSVIRATVKDANSNAVADGETITFSMTAGTGTLSSLTGTTTGGVVTVTYTASNAAGTETVQAQSTNGTTTTVNITLVAASVGSVTLSSGASNLTADGSSQTTITATVKDTGGNNVADGTTVNFTTTAGTLSAASGTTANGLATVTLTSPSNVGSTTVTGTSGGVSGTATVNFVPGAVNTISLTATPNNLTADGVSTSVIRAVVKDANSNAVADGETITFSVTAGTGTLSTLTGTTTGGIVTVTYTASNSAGTETVTADSTNGKTKSVNITLIAEQIGEITLSTDDGSLVADGVNSSTVRANVKNINGNSIADGTTVNFSTTKGTISAASADTLGGLATVVLTSPVTVGTAVIKATAGSITQITTVQFVPGITSAVTLTADPTVIDADGSSTSLISAYAVDANNNPVADNTTVTFFITAGTLSNSSVATSNGVAQVFLTSSTNNETATVTAVSDLVPQTVQVTFGSGPGSGEPSYIIITANPDKIKVKGTGGIESSTITASVKDENGQPYNDSADNITFEILSGPGGGVVLDSGDGSPSSAETTTTQGGIAAMSLKSGTVSGTVRIKVTVLKDGSGVALVIPLTAISTIIGIEAGDPFNMTVYPSTDGTDNGDGSLSQIFSAMIQDQYGNPVSDNTGVYFGIVDNPANGYKSSAADGITNATNTFASATTNFISDGIIQFDTLIIREGQDEGGHIVETPANGSMTLVYNLTGTEAGLDFVAGDAELGVICGVVPTGNQEPDTSCTPTGGNAIKGVAHTRLTWPGKAIFKPFYLYAESEGRNLGKSYSGTYSALSPVTIDVNITPFNTVFAGTTAIVVNAHFYDGASNDIQSENLTFTTGNTMVSGFGSVGTATETATTGTDGFASVSDLVTKSCLDAQSQVTISVSHGQYSGTETLTIEATKPTADFTFTDQADSDHVIFLDDSTTVTGSSITAWSWDFDNDGTEDSNVQNPGIVSMGAAGSYLSTLTVTNSLGCTDTIIKTVTVP